MTADDRIRPSSFILRHLSFVIRPSSFVTRHSSFVIPYSSFVIRHLSFIIPFVLLSLTSCSKDDDAAYPSLITEMVMAQADGAGQMASFTTDAGVAYTVENAISGMDSCSVVRCLCGYTVEDNGRAHVYTARAVPVLSDLSHLRDLRRDPTGILSAWLSGGYVNLHLTPKTQGGRQAWGFLRDSSTVNAGGGTTYHLSLYHDQRDDPPAYSTDLYACIAMDSLAAAPLTQADSLVLTVQTFKQPAVWQLAVGR